MTHQNFNLHLPEPKKPVKLRFTGGLLSIFWWTDDDTTGLADFVKVLPHTLDELHSHVLPMYPGAQLEAVDIPDFKTFWENYGHKVGRTDAEKAWNKLSDRTKALAVAHIPTYHQRKAKEGTALQYPATYLHKQPWKDK